MSSDENSDDDFVAFGTALDPLDEDLFPRKKAFTLEDQVARDAKGRRRFHGAFTGGFSAGFMNTVGSLEGWKPSEFKSTREERAGSKTQNPQDFMDDEDLGEFGIAPKRLTARAEFSSDFERTRKRPVPETMEGPIPGVPALADLLQPVRETVGIKLLKKMGWRPGQGVGPRISRKEKQRMYGCSLPPGEEEAGSDDSDFEFENVTYAPDDIKPYIRNPKKDVFGLGYSGLDRHSVLGISNVSSELKFTDMKRKVNIRGQAFGVGAFEDEDEDIYSKEDMSQYDFALGGETSKIKAINQRTPGILEGFVLSKTKVVKKVFPPPPLPKGFKPRQFLKPPTESPPLSGQGKAPSGLGRHDLNAQARGVILNESSQIPQIPEPVVDVQVKKENITSDGSGFQPFKADPEKQKRYEQYLTLKDKGKLRELQPLHMNQWEREREDREFAQAEKMFKPLTGVMSDRFTSAALSEDLNDPMIAVEKVLHGQETQRNAAKMKMFGKLTREETPWNPCSLICKRFNVPEPDVCPSKAPTHSRSKFSIFDALDDLVVKQETAACDNDETAMESSVSSQSATSIAKSLSLVTTDLFTDPVSKVDLFKAIFLDSSDEEEDKSVVVPKLEVAYDEPIVNTIRNKSPQRGLFADVDLDALCARPANIPPPQPIRLEQPVVSENASESESLHYGPKLPDTIMPTKECKVVERIDSSEEDWVEKSTSQSKKDKKSKKNKKHKSKHKKKKKRK